MLASALYKQQLSSLPRRRPGWSLSDYRSVAMTAVLMKVQESLVIRHLLCTTRGKLDALKFAYRTNRSVDDDIFQALHLSSSFLNTFCTIYINSHCYSSYSSYCSYSSYYYCQCPFYSNCFIPVLQEIKWFVVVL